MKSAKLLFAMACSSVIAACGGGSSGGTPPNGATSVAAVKIAGTGAKGIIKHAIVTAYELDAGGKTLRTVGTSETDASGKYSLNTNSSYTGGPLKLELTAKSDGSTKMVCDVAAGCGTGVAFGQDYPLSTTFKLGAYQQGNTSGTAVTTQITPYSNMVVARVEAQVQAGTTLNNSLVAGAVSQVNQIVGVDISTTEPVDITNASAVAAASANALQYAAFNAGIGDVAFSNAGGFNAGIAAAAASFADGKFDSTDPVTIAAITTAVNTEAQATPALNTTMLTATLASITTNTTNGTFTPTAPSTTTLTAVAQAKDLVSQTRTWGTQIKAMKTPADAFNVDIKTAQSVLNSGSASLGGVLLQTLGNALHEVKIQAASGTGLQATNYPFTVSYMTSSGMASGNGTVIVADTGGKLTLSVSALGLAGINCTGTITTDISSSILGTPTTSLNLGATNTLSVSGNAVLASSTASPLPMVTINNAALNVVLSAAKSSSALAVGDIASMTLNAGTIGVTSANSASPSSPGITIQAGGVAFNGMGKIAMVANGNTQVNAAHSLTGLSLAEIALSGTFHNLSGNTSANATASIKFNNAATFDTIAYLNHQPVVNVHKWVQGDKYGVVQKFALVTTNPAIPSLVSGDTLLVGSYDSVANQTCGYGPVVGNQCLSGDQFNLLTPITNDILNTYTYPVPTSVQNVYASYDIYSNATWYNASVIYPDFETASNFATATITVSTGVVLPNNPAATLTVTANRTGFNTSAQPILGDADAVLAFNGQTVNFYASNSGKYPVTTDCAVANAVTTGTTGASTPVNPAFTLIISNPNGVKLVLNGGNNNKSTGLVCVGSTKVGTIDGSGTVPLINYTDGTFESLN